MKGQTASKQSKVVQQHLQIHLRVPVTVIQDDNICSVQVDAQAASTRRQQENKLLAALCIVAVDLCLSVLSRCVA